MIDFYQFVLLPCSKDINHGQHLLSYVRNYVTGRSAVLHCSEEQISKYILCLNISKLKHRYYLYTIKSVIHSIYNEIKTGNKFWLIKP